MRQRSAAAGHDRRAVHPRLPRRGPVQRSQAADHGPHRAVRVRARRSSSRTSRPATTSCARRSRPSSASARRSRRPSPAATPRRPRSAPTSTGCSAGRAPCPVTGPGVRVTVERPAPGRRHRAAAQRAAQRRRRGGRDRRRADRARRRRDGSGGRASSSAACRSATPSSSPPSASRRSLAGSLGRAGGPIAQLSARFPDVVIARRRGRTA